MQKHLEEKEYTAEEIAECIDFLSDCRFVDDEDYCRRYIEYSIEKGRGPVRIRHELLQKGIAEQQIALGMEELYDTSLQREVALSQAEKALDIRGERPAEKELARVARRLSGQGFGGSIVYDVLARLRERRR